ncbi:hypothetical protein CDL12_20157 [Handroanthus impetiginosus]|uniref:Uncharacterized protein n=1 Tax=Handroanthus impetiginosus TaxID=429701 RepID=A0A2G9GPR3_9LAMI|nr:hypothetical protein CDL12_20157 [Handroanthus impetiginosus]
MTSSTGFPVVDAEKELNLSMNKDFQIDPISSDIVTTKQEKHEAKKLKEQEKKEALQSFKRALTVSGIIVAVAGAIFAITKKLREK